MARYTGPAWKISRRLGFSTLETGQELAKRSYPPGQHGQGRKKETEYGRQLKEKQKVRHMYGVNEKQFRRLFLKARKGSDVTGSNFLILLESRLDNLVYRLGFAKTRRGARQLVNHGHILLDGHKADIPSITVQLNQKITLREKSLNLKAVKEALEVAPTRPGYIAFDAEKLVGEFTRLPERSELNQEINENLNR